MPGQTGPRTIEGKAKVAKNALKHGLTSDCLFVLRNETEEIWTAFLRDWRQKYQPRDAAECFVVEEIAHAHWKVRRVRTWEAGMLDTDGADFKELADTSKALDAIHRYENRARRALRLSIVQLQDLQRMLPARPEVHELEPVPPPPPPPASVLYPTMPDHLQCEYDYLGQTISHLHPYWHRGRMTEELNKWLRENTEM